MAATTTKKPSLVKDKNRFKTTTEYSTLKGNGNTVQSHYYSKQLPLLSSPSTFLWDSGYTQVDRDWRTFVGHNTVPLGLVRTWLVRTMFESMWSNCACKCDAPFFVPSVL